MTSPTTSEETAAETFDSLGAIDALEAAGFERERAAALSHQLLLAANSTPDTIEKELDDLTKTVIAGMRQTRLITAGFTVLNLAIFFAILVSLELP